MNKKLYFFILLFCPFILLSQEIYTPNKEFVFKVRYENNGVVKESYLSLWTQDSVWIYDNAQQQLFYAYHENADFETQKTFPYDKAEETGFIETNEKIWLHPPREDYFYLFEYFPFPEMNFPVQCEKKGKYAFLGSIDFLDKFSLLRYKTKIECGKPNLIYYYGKAKNRTGEWSFKYVFDKERGFVEWRIEYNQTISIHLTFDKIIPR
jgi:hypothetical protein